MYYLYSKKGKGGIDDHQNASTSGRTSSSTTAPMTLHSTSHSSRLRPVHPPGPKVVDEGNNSVPSLDLPEGLDSSHRSQHHQPGQGGRPAPTPSMIDDSSAAGESKKDEQQVVRRLSRRRGLEENDFTEEVMQPMRPNRISCQRCHNHIATNDGQHRIKCSDRGRHVFCKACLVNYVALWVEGDAQYDLRIGNQNLMGSSRGMYGLPCMSPVCQKGCLLETSMQSLLSPTLFMSCRQKLARVRSEISRSNKSNNNSNNGNNGGGEGGISTTVVSGHQPPRRRSVPREESPPSSRPIQPQRQQHHQSLYPQQDHIFQVQQQQLLLEQSKHRHQQHEHLSQRQNLYHDPSSYPHALAQNHHQRNPMNEHPTNPHMHNDSTHQPHHQPVPLTTALRRTSTHSSAASEKTQKTSKSVRFSFVGEIDQDLLSLGGSSTSSLTTRFPVSVDDNNGGGKMTEKEETKRHRQRQLQLLDQQKLHHSKVKYGSNPKHLERHRQRQLEERRRHQHEEPHHHIHVKKANCITCQCCYEDIPNVPTSIIVSCGQRHPNDSCHRFCAKCVRLYVEEWVFGAADYTLRPGPTQDAQGDTSLVLPCLHGDCADGGFADEAVSRALSPRSVEKYLSKINPLRIQKQDDEERLVQMAIRLSLEQEEIQRRVARLHEEQKSVTHGEDNLFCQPIGGGRGVSGGLPTAVNVPETALSTTSSLTSYNTLIQTRSLPDLPRRGNLDMKTLAAKLKDPPSKATAEDEHSKNCERSVHEVEEAMTLAKVRTCPNCRTKFLKEQDFCNKLKCPSCKTAICYICRKIIPTQGYEHFCIHKQGGCEPCKGIKCPLWTEVNDDNQRDMEEMRARGLDEANRIWEESLLQQSEIRVDVDSLLQQPSSSRNC